MPPHIQTIDDVELSCSLEGQGIPLVLIHGFPFDHTMWQKQIDAFRETNLVISPDLRGYGSSQQSPTDSTGGVEMQRYAEDILALLDSLPLDEPPVFCGFSMGGYILWQIAMLAPERVRAMILCDTRAAADTDEARQGRMAMAESVQDTGVEPIVEALVPKLLAPATMESNADLVTHVSNLIRKASPTAIAASQRGMAIRPDVTPQLSEFQMPALVVVGAEDAISTSSEMREIGKALPNAKFVEIPSAGHMTPLENPTAVNEAFQDFLNQL